MLSPTGKKNSSFFSFSSYIFVYPGLSRSLSLLLSLPVLISPPLSLPRWADKLLSSPFYFIFFFFLLRRTTVFRVTTAILELIMVV